MNRPLDFSEGEREPIFGSVEIPDEKTDAEDVWVPTPPTQNGSDPNARQPIMSSLVAYDGEDGEALFMAAPTDLDPTISCRPLNKWKERK